MEYAIEFRNVSKIYTLKSKDKKRKNTKRFYALKDLSFKIPKGEVVGILGTNGSGKSTMSLILSGISEIDSGEMIVNGEQALIALKTGLNKQLTGYENIRLKGALLGFSKKKTDEVIEGVVAFAELGDFLYQPVKKYSSGMKSRLEFSINLCLNPDILVVDEALSVGDKAFAKKCMNKMTELKEEGKTIIFVSHSLAQLKSFCDQALWIEGGMFHGQGPIKELVVEYEAYVEYLSNLSAKEKKAITEEKFNQRVIESENKSIYERILGK